MTLDEVDAILRQDMSEAARAKWRASHRRQRLARPHFVAMFHRESQGEWIATGPGRSKWYPPGSLIPYTVEC